MYKLVEVFDKISLGLNLDLKEKERAMRIHTEILECISSEYRDKAYFRYNERSKNIALNIDNYRIYLYPYKNIKDRYELIYPKSKLSELEALGIELEVTFDFKSIPCKEVALSFDDIDKFTSVHWSSFKDAIRMAYESNNNRVRDNNIEIDWEDIRSK